MNVGAHKNTLKLLIPQFMNNIISYLLVYLKYKYYTIIIKKLINNLCM